MNGSEMLREGIEPSEAPVTPQTQTPQTENKVDPAVKALEREIASLRGRVNESEQNARFWYERAKVEPVKPAPQVEEKKLDPADFVELLTTKGPAAVEELIEKKLKQGGFVSREEVERTITAVRQQATVEAQLQRDYPDLADESSDLFKETAKQYQALIAEAPELKGKPAAMRTAAKLAAAELDLDPPEPRPRRATSQREDVENTEPDDADEREAQRVRRVRSQQSSSRRTQREESDDELSPIQKSIVENLRNAGANITEEKLKKRIQGGTSLSGRIGLAVAAVSGARGKGRR